MDQHSQYYSTQQFLEPNKDTNKSQRTKSTTNDLLTSPNIVYITRAQQQSQPQKRLESQQPILKPSQSSYNVKEVVKVIEPDELIFYRNRCSFQEKQLQDLQTELHRIRSTAQERVTYIEDTHRIQLLEANLQQYQQECNRMNNLLREAANETEQLKQKNLQLSQQLFQFQQQQIEFDKLKRNTQETDQYWQNEIQRLNVLVSQSQSQLHQLQRTLIETKKYEQMYHQQQPIQTQLAMELERTSSVLKAKVEEYDQQKQTYIKEIEILSRRIKDSESELKDLRIRESNQKQSIDELSKENNQITEKFMNEIRNKNDEIQKLQQIIQTLQLTLQDTSKYQEYEIRSKMQNEEIHNLNQRIRIKQDETDKLKQQLLIFQSQIQEYQKYTEYEMKYQNLAQEYDRVNNSLMIKLQENDQLRNCISKLQITLNDHYKIEEYENKIALQSQEIDRLHQCVQTKCEEIEKLSYESMRANSLLRTKNDEIDSLKYKVQDTQQLKEYQQKVQMLNVEVERLSSQLRSKNEEMEKLRQYLGQFQLQEANKIQELEQKNVVYQTEIERLSNLLKVKLSENEQSKQQIQYLQEENDQQKSKLLTQQENQQYTEKITVLTQEVDSWKNQFINLNREYHKQQEQLMLSNAELDTLKKQRTNSFKLDSYETMKENSSLSAFQYGTLTLRNI
ncbi:unnamed protein product (macronuclear) [Paramecium tetraurelia]|uniref:Uncharacterized protein n=1 Tax=Paramecium tetraurelia TaxID=5888 RepID=A0DDI9_PARTE|nr:uncharacterized protein GSPATT00015966001 [Paramecium tetraurelia]CAK81106.1 unnamed protein product [Paramecium tetraurelia]|eukprot:XP_001448503.1 hypothetical protein (macronuclear) [Paramecium tetraurelia strain d4-2]